MNDKLEQRNRYQNNEHLDTWQKGKMDNHLDQINQASRGKERAQTTDKAGKRSKNLYILSATSGGTKSRDKGPESFKDKQESTIRNFAREAHENTYKNYAREEYIKNNLKQSKSMAGKVKSPRMQKSFLLSANTAQNTRKNQDKILDLWRNKRQHNNLVMSSNKKIGSKRYSVATKDALSAISNIKSENEGGPGLGGDIEVAENINQILDMNS